MLLSEVALGDMYELKHAEFVVKPPHGKHSTWGQGRYVPDPDDTTTMYAHTYIVLVVKVADMVCVCMLVCNAATVMLWCPGASRRTPSWTRRPACSTTYVCLLLFMCLTFCVCAGVYCLRHCTGEDALCAANEVQAPQRLLMSRRRVDVIPRRRHCWSELYTMGSVWRVWCNGCGTICNEEASFSSDP